MYTPAAFRDTDAASVRQHMLESRLAILVTQGQDGLHATHLPLLFEEGEPHGLLLGHLARANEQWKALAGGNSALVIFPGADAYVSPSAYASKAEHGKVVPTWNYTAVHAWASPEVFDDATQLLAVVQKLSERHEASQATPWAVGDAPAGYIAGMLKGIVGLRLVIERIEGKRKLSQNRSQADIDGVRRYLAASDEPRDRELAALM